MGILRPILARRPKTRGLTVAEVSVLREAVRHVRMGQSEAGGRALRALALGITLASLFWAVVGVGLFWWFLLADR